MRHVGPHEVIGVSLSHDYGSISVAVSNKNYQKTLGLDRKNLVQSSQKEIVLEKRRDFTLQKVGIFVA